MATWLRSDPVRALARVVLAVSDRGGTSLRQAVLRTAETVHRRLPGSTLATAAIATIATRTGDRDRLDRLVQGLISDGSVGARAGLAVWLAATDVPAPALALVAGLPDGRHVHAARGRALWALGDLTAAAAEFAQAYPRSHPLRRRLDMDIGVLSGAWHPPAHPRARLKPRQGRLLWLVNNSLPLVQAGYTIRTQRSLAALLDAGFRPVAVTKLGFPWSQGYTPDGNLTRVSGVTYCHHRDDHVPLLGFAERIERGIARLLPVVAEQRPQALHTTTPFDNAFVVRALADRTGLPFVYEFRGFLEDSWLARADGHGAASELYQLTRQTEGEVAASADRVITLSEAMKADLVERGVDVDRIAVIPNGVDPSFFRPRGNAAHTRQALGIESRAITLGYVSTLNHYEGVDTLLAAAQLLHHRSHDVHVLIVGDGPARSQLERRATELGIADRVTFTGRVPQLRVVGLYEAIDLFVVPRRNERVCRHVTPLKPFEAMAMQRPLVVSNIPALRELLARGDVGRTFEAENRTSLADTLEPLLLEPETRAQLGAMARQVVLEHFTWRHAARRYAAVYESLGVAPSDSAPGTADRDQG